MAHQKKIGVFCLPKLEKVTKIYILCHNFSQMHDMTIAHASIDRSLQGASIDGMGCRNGRGYDVTVTS